jgi:hypothetical protein
MIVGEFRVESLEWRALVLFTLFSLLFAEFSGGKFL